MQIDPAQPLTTTDEELDDLDGGLSVDDLPPEVCEDVVEMFPYVDAPFVVDALSVCRGKPA